MSLGSQKTLRLEGFVRDTKGNALTGAIVEVRPLTTVRSPSILQTNNLGYFSLLLEPGRYHVRIARLDRIAWEDSLEIWSGTRELAVVLRDKALRLSPIRIAAQRQHVAPPQTSHYQIRREDVQQKVGGFEDVMRNVQALPGVSAPSDLHGEFFVRGSSAAANAIFLDGIEVMFPYHILGFNSVFSPGLVQQAEFYSANAPVEYAAATGGVLVVESRGGRPAAPSADVGLSWLSGQVNATVGSPNRGLTMSLRRSYHDKLVQLLGEVPNQQIPTFHEVHIRGRWSPRPGHTLSVGLLRAGDGMSIPSPEAQAQNYSLVQAQDGSGADDSVANIAPSSRGDRLWVDNRLSVLSVQHSVSLSSQAHLQTTLGWVPQRFHFNLRSRDTENVDVQSSVASLRQTATWQGTEHRIRFGWRLYRDAAQRQVSVYSGLLQLKQGTTSLNLRDLTKRYDFHTWRLRGSAAVHVADSWQPGQGPWKFDSAVRLEHDTLIGDTFIDPRFAVAYRWGADWHVEATWGSAHTLRDKSVDIAPTVNGASLRAEKAITRTLGLTGTWSGGWRGGATVWQKRMSNLVYEVEPAYYANGAQGKAIGFETWLEWAAPRSSWSNRLQYSWSRTLQRNPVMFRRNAQPGATVLSPWGPRFEAPYWFHPVHDVRHQLSLDARYRWSSWQFASQLRLNSGRPWTPVGQVLVDATGRRIGIEARRGSARLPLYARLDVRVARHFRGQNVQWNIYAEVLNVTQARNVFQHRYDTGYHNRIDLLMLPALPTLGFEVRF